MGSWKSMLHWLHILWATMKATLINLGQDSSMQFVHCECRLKNRPKEGSFLLQFVLMPNDVPPQRGRERNFIVPFIGIQFLKCILSSDPLPTKLGGICQEKSNLRPPPLYWVKEKWPQFTQKRELNLVWTLPQDNLSTLTCEIKPEKAMECSTFLASSFTSTRVKYCKSTVDLGKIPRNSALICTRRNLNLEYPTHTTHSGMPPPWFYTNQPIHVKWVEFQVDYASSCKRGHNAPTTWPKDYNKYLQGSRVLTLRILPCEWLVPHTTDLFVHKRGTNPPTLAFGTHSWIGNQCLDVDFHPWKSNL